MGPSSPAAPHPGSPAGKGRVRPGPEQLQPPRAIPLRGTVPRRRRGRRHPGDRGWAARASPRPTPAGKPFPGTCPGAGGRAHPIAPSALQKGDGVGWGSGSEAPQAGSLGRSVTARRSGPSTAAGPRRRACASARRVRRPLVAGGGSTPPSPPARRPARPALVARGSAARLRATAAVVVSSSFPPTEAERHRAEVVPAWRGRRLRVAGLHTQLAGVVVACTAGGSRLNKQRCLPRRAMWCRCWIRW